MANEREPPIEVRIKDAEGLHFFGTLIGWTGLIAFAPLAIAGIALFTLGDHPYTLISVFVIALYWPFGVGGAAMGLLGLICAARASSRLETLRRKAAGLPDADIGPPYSD